MSIGDRNDTGGDASSDSSERDADEANELIAKEEEDGNQKVKEPKHEPVL